MNYLERIRDYKDYMRRAKATGDLLWKYHQIPKSERIKMKHKRNNKPIDLEQHYKQILEGEIHD